MTAKVFNGSPKQYAESIGIGKGGRGRPTAAQVEAIAKFRSSGGTFQSEIDASAPKAKRVAVKPKPVREVTKPEKVEAKQTDSPAAVDPAVVRAWAVEKGIEVSARGRLNHEVVAQYLAEVPEDERPERKVDMYGPTPPDVNPPGTVYVYTDRDGKARTTTGGNGRAACMKSGYSLVGCGHHAGAHRILIEGAEQVDVTVKA